MSINKREFVHDLKKISEKIKVVREDFNRDMERLQAACDDLFNHFLKEERKEIRKDG